MSSTGFYVNPDGARTALEQRRQFNAIETQHACTIDLIVKKDRPFSEEEFSRRLRVDLTFARQGAVVTPEDAVLSKLEWAKRGDSERQRRDATTAALLTQNRRHRTKTRITVMRRALAVSSLAAVTLVSLAAQERIPAGPAPNDPTFDVVSIKRVTELRTSRSIGDQPGGRFVLSGLAIAPVIRTAYPADISDLINAPDWVNNETYDLTAQAGRDVSRQEMEALLRTMLADRFKLAVHYEMQERPVYALTLARPDGRLGPNIRRSNLDCDAIQAARRAGSKEQPPATSNGAPACGMSMRGTGGMEVLLGARPLSTLASSFGTGPGRVVIDKTGLMGNYDITLNYLPQPQADAPPDAPPNVFTALQEQLGLKLEPDRAPLKVLVIDRIERPSEN